MAREGDFPPVSFQVIWRLLFQAIWRMITRTKGPGSHARPGTLAGLKVARTRGRKGGRPRKLQAKELKTIRTLLKTAEIPVQEVATRFGVSRSTLYRNRLA
jgi:transcriptional regulator with PAS, ATPase and Fis domain